MILEVDKIKDYEVDGSDGLDGGEVSIDMSNIGLFYDMMSKSIYSNPHGSIVRELVSNGFDAHVEAVKEGLYLAEDKKPVIIKTFYEEDSYFISFQDFGIGMDEERFKDVYLKYLSSTKRKTNDYMGAMGLGSKSPFSYTESFYILTRHNGVEWYYVMSRGQEGKPKWDLLYKKSTTEVNGTTIKFIIDGGRYGKDFSKFQDEVKNQLRYFDDVYVDGLNVENEYEIIDYPTFKYRKDTQVKQMHIALGKVTYPIDWTILKRPIVNVPVGVKFEIGELMITSNRESIRYNDEVIDIINKRIDATLKELASLADTGTFDKLADLLAARKEATKFIRLEGDVKLPVYPGLSTFEGEDDYPFFIPKPQWTPFAGTPIEVPANPFFIFRSIGFVDRRGTYMNVKSDDKKRNRQLPYNYSDVYQMSLSKVLYRTNDFTINRMKIAYLGEKANVVGYGDVCILSKDNQLGFKTILSKIGLMKVAKSPFVKGRTMVAIPAMNTGWSKVKLLALYRKEMLKEIIRLSKSYDTLEVPEDFAKEFRAKFKSTRLVASDGEIPILDINKNLDNKVMTPMKELEAGLVIYGNNQDKNRLVAIARMLSPRVWRKKDRSFKGTIKNIRAYRIIGLNLTDIKRMEGENQISIDKFVGNHKVFIEQATAYYIYRKYEQLDLDHLYELMPPVKHYSDTLSNFIERTIGSEYNKPAVLESKFVKEFLEIAEAQGLFIKEYVDMVENLTILQKDMRLIEHIFKGIGDTPNLSQKRDIAKFIIGKGYTVDAFFLFSPTQEELEWANSLVKYYGKDKYGYVKDVSERSMEELLREAYNSRLHNKYSLYTPIKSWHRNFQVLNGNKSVKISMLSLTRREIPSLSL